LRGAYFDKGARSFFGYRYAGPNAQIEIGALNTFYADKVNADSRERIGGEAAD